MTFHFNILKFIESLRKFITGHVEGISTKHSMPFRSLLFVCALTSIFIAPTVAIAQIDCSIRIVQDGTEVRPTQADKVSVFKLQPSDFRLEVGPASCDPSMALVTPHQLAYITQTPLVFSGSGVFIAGDFSDTDMLTHYGAENPRTTFEEITDNNDFRDQIKQQYADVCKTLRFCPTPVLAFSSSWPFLDPKTREFRGYAEFKRFNKFGAMHAAAGRVLLVVVYTRWRTLTQAQHSWFYVLRPHAIALDFR